MAEKAPDPTPAEQSKAIAESNAEAEKRQIDETIPGGRYLLNGRFVNSEGEPIEEKAKD